MGTLGCSATVWAASALLACLQNALEGAAGKAWCDVVGPILPNLLVPDRRQELLAGILESSLDFAAKVNNQGWLLKSVSKHFITHTHTPLWTVYLTSDTLDTQLGNDSQDQRDAGT